MRNFEYMTAAGPLEAIAAGAAGGKFIAGGTDLVQLMKDDVEAPAQVVGLERLPFRAITASPDGLTIGALVTMHEAAAHPAVVRDYPVISQALLASAAPQLRNMATMGGNLLQRTRCGYFRDTGFACNKRDPGSGCPAIHGENRLHAILGVSDHCIATHPSDLAVALVALGALLDLRGPQGRRQVALADFYLMPGATPQNETVLRPGELIVALRVPAVPGRSAYLKVRDRAAFEFAVLSAAVALDLADGRVRAARVAVGGVGTVPWRLPQVETALIGQPANEASFADAAAQSREGTMPASQNGFKVTLMQRTIVRALQQAMA